MQLVRHLFLTILVCYTLVFLTVACGYSTTNSSSQACSYKTHTTSTEVSNYDSVRTLLDITDFVDSFGFSPISVVSKLGKVAIYAEDWIHTDKEIKNRINDILNSPTLVNVAKYPELYSKFKYYVQKTIKDNWVPDRDYPKIGYLPKELIFDKCLGEENITKYWPEASPQEQHKYTALTFDELVINYEIVWHNLLLENNKS